MAGATTTSFGYNNVNALTSPGPAVYDVDGEPLTLGGATYQWDAASRLISVAAGGKTTRFAYDGLGRRTRITRLSGSTVVSDKFYFWCGPNFPCLEKDAVSHAVTKRYFSEGVQVNGQPFYYALDSLGSVRQLVSAAGAVAASYDYDPYGVRTKIGGAQDSDFGFAGLFHESQSGLDLALFRPYNGSLGRWLVRDPASEIGGLNLYAYVANNPLTYMDPLGLCVGTQIAGFFGRILAPFLRWYRAPSNASATARMLAAMEEHGRVLTLRAAAVAEESYATEAAVDAALATETATLEATAPALAAAEAEVGAALAASAEAAWASTVTVTALSGGALVIAAAGIGYFAYQYFKEPPPRTFDEGPQGIRG